MTTLTSRNNPNIKLVRKLLAQRKERERTGLFVAEGIRHVGEAIEAHAKIDFICYSPSLLKSEYGKRLIDEQSKNRYDCLAVDEDIFLSLAGKENPQGILAVIHTPHISIEELTPTNFPWGVALVAPQDPGNIGSILRTIDAVGASGLILLDDPESTQYSADPNHPASVRASMGAIFWYPPIRALFQDFVQWAKMNGIIIFGTSAHAQEDYRQVSKYTPPFILLMGSEREGLTSAQAEACNHLLKLPMHGHVTSLNLAIATGVMLYTIFDKME